MANRYTDEQVAAALARIALGESVMSVAADTGISRVRLQQRLREQRLAAGVLTVTTPVTDLRARMETYMGESLETLTAHVVHYRSEEWMQGDPSKLLESTRTVGSRLAAIIDRLPGGRASANTDG